MHEKKYSGEEIEKPRTLFTVYEEENEDPTLTCEHRDRVAGSDYGLEAHRETLTRKGEGDNNIPRNGESEECEESYFATKGDDNVIKFTCKKCDKSCASQMAIKGHVKMKH